jgi:ATP-dependent Clp protease ATP-binding subunit ClpB
VQVLITQKMMKDLIGRLQSRNIQIDMGEDVQKYIIKHGYQEEYGARPLKRFIQRQIETFIASKIISGDIKPHQSYVIYVGDDALQIKSS